MPSTYLYLNPKNRVLGLNGRLLWQNVPNLSLTSRQCYLSVSQFGIQINESNVDDRFVIKMNLASQNYYSSDNDGVVVCALQATRIVAPRTVYQLSVESGSPIEILTNDNYNTLEFFIIDSAGDVRLVDDADSVDVVLKFDYPDVEDVQQVYVETMPKRLL